MDSALIMATVVLVLTTVSYKLYPYRTAGEKKPRVSLYPKYKKEIRHPLSEEEVCSIMTEMGFSLRYRTKAKMIYSRGSIAGDFSLKFAQVLAKIHEKDADTYEITVEAGWVAAFDTGDFWKLITEISDRLENSEAHALSH